MKNRHQIIFLFIFFVSGFTGLIYESIWTHYLKLFLGHAAYAQTLVLTIFMGGMAIGSYLTSFYSIKWRKLFLAYAIAEGIIGVLALIFHESFTSFLEISFNSVFQNLDTPLAINLYKWVSAALLILPQSILLGATFPLMSAAILRVFPESPGKTISLLYFSNSLGAAIGVLISGFYFVKEFGLPGTIKIAGLLNVLIVAAIIVLIRRNREYIQLPIQPSEEKKERGQNKSILLFVLLGVSSFTGMASFIYEIGWIRMLNMVLGTSTHAFELMLSAFIFGLAFGGLWIRKRIDKMSNPIAYLGYIQIIMGVMALSTLLIYGNTFNLMQWLLENLDKDANGYLLFNLSSNGIALLIMFPTTFCAGMTLPIITTILLGVRGERSIGSVYAWNTIGAIIGIFIAVHIGMPYLGLKGLISLGAGIDIALGIFLLFAFSQVRNKFNRKVIMASIGVISLCGIMFFVELDTLKMGSGVFRGRDSLFSSEENNVLFHEDGKTASISVIEHKALDGMLSVRTNGKTDATIYKDERPLGTIDESTMIQLAVIPMALNPKAEHVVNIGLGAGITTKSVLANPLIQSIHTIEIEKEMVNAAKLLGAQSEVVFSDPRSTIIIDDAKSFFASHQKKYDIILSEPSNPWVSGVSGLFSEEFYKMINAHLNDDGVFAQWLQLYDLDINLVSSVLKAVSQNFSDFEVYALNHDECLIVAKKNGLLPPLDSTLISMPSIEKALNHVSVNTVQDIEFRLFGNKKTMDPFLASFTIPANSDYYPVLDQNATRTRFLKSKATELYNFTHQFHPVISMLNMEFFPWNITNITATPYFYNQSVSANEAISLRDFYLHDNFNLNYNYLPQNLRDEARLVKNSFGQDKGGVINKNRFTSFFYSTIRMAPYLTPHEMELVWESIGIYEDATMASEELKWASLFRAAVHKDAKTMIELGESLLNNTSEGLKGYPKEYVISTIMLGHIVQNELEKAQRVWYTNSNNLTEDPQSKLLFQFLIAQCNKIN